MRHKFFLYFIFLFILIPILSFSQAQIDRIVLSDLGRILEVYVNVYPFEICVNDSGAITDVNIITYGNIDFQYQSFDENIEKADDSNIEIDYFDGRVLEIGSTSFEYNIKYDGLIVAIGDIRFEYDTKYGVPWKLTKVDSYDIGYRFSSDSRVEYIGGARFEYQPFKNKITQIIGDVDSYENVQIVINTNALNAINKKLGAERKKSKKPSRK
ncbi:MAG: hypothetical protein HN921_13570 [Bacteroidetes bacterium]|jgi:hypothetical protein|nr:hypothetical protein [Candidatus Neomarinimicrobiota bacterium]MBT5528786.1 hypothetical protein [Cytophagia bacterium]MBT7040860.1 hypothetical protein [Bacteroidota bacterium]MBT4852676.1 hypothetical protein [Candidatus Neomarinimicrobiota bacterium]MBT6217499.1 hypothetical protein [Candidatus Neomarinimicrobiota bacterium]